MHAMTRTAQKKRIKKAVCQDLKDVEENRSEWSQLTRINRWIARSLTSAERHIIENYRVPPNGG
jgi:hypothetical protein